jgi:Uma2 family endonuclease
MVLKITTTEEFEAFAFRPENRDRLFELIEGRIVEVVSNHRSSEIAMLIGALLLVFVRSKKLGRVTGADGGYTVAGDRYIPDIGYIAFERQPQSSNEAYNPNPPDLAIEVLSPTNDEHDMRIKVVNYLRAGTEVWIVDPRREQIERYRPGYAPRTYRGDDVLDGETLLPGFELSLREVFGV